MMRPELMFQLLDNIAETSGENGNIKSAIKIWINRGFENRAVNRLMMKALTLQGVDVSELNSLLSLPEDFPPSSDR